MKHKKWCDCSICHDIIENALEEAVSFHEIIDKMIGDENEYYRDIEISVD